MSILQVSRSAMTARSNWVQKIICLSHCIAVTKLTLLFIYLVKCNIINDNNVYIIVCFNPVCLFPTGYQRELTYQHKDGSFSAFGDQDKSGSMW